MKPIMSAAKGGNLEVVKLLASKGADVNAHNQSGSALMWAVNSGNADVVKFLLMKGAEPGGTNCLGETALDFARATPGRPVVFLAVGFETTAPATAATVRDAQRDQVDNFSVVMCHKLVVPAMLALPCSQGSLGESWLTAFSESQMANSGPS